MESPTSAVLRGESYRPLFGLTFLAIRIRLTPISSPLEARVRRLSDASRLTRVSEEGRPHQSTNITRLRVIYRDSKSDARILLALRDELKKRRTKSARELLATVQRQLDRVIAKQRDEMSGGKPTTDDTLVSDEARDGIEGTAKRVLSSRELAAQKRIADLRMRLLDLSNGNRLLNYKFSNRSRRHVRLVDELPDKIIDKLVEGKRLTFQITPGTRRRTRGRKERRVPLGA